MIYLDSSAVIKLVRREAETDPLRAWVEANPQPLVSSALARTETMRALARRQPDALPSLRAVLALLHQYPISDAILDTAATLPGAYLRTLDAIHVATAQALIPGLTWFVAYDTRLAEAAAGLDLPVVSPR